MGANELVADAIHRLFVRENAWPTWGELDHELFRTGGVSEPWEEVRQVDARLLWGFGDIEPQDDQRVGLSIAGLALCRDAKEDLQIFVASVRYAAELAAEAPFNPPPELTPATVVQHVPTPAAGRTAVLERLGVLWSVSPRLTLGFSFQSSASEWVVRLNRKTLRRFRGVESVEEYLSLLDLSRPGVSGDSEPWKDRSYGTTEQVPRGAA